MSKKRDSAPHKTRRPQRKKEEPPPFDPDLRLVRFREGGDKAAAEEWVRKAIERPSK